MAWGDILYVTGTTNNKSIAKIARTHLIIELLRFINSTRNSREISISVVW